MKLIISLAIGSALVAAFLLVTGESSSTIPRGVGTHDNSRTVRTAPKPGTYDIYRGPNYTKRIILTFDDCPRSLGELKRVVVGAKRLNIGLVLAPTGECLAADRFLPKFARSHGHYVINHSVDHAELTRLSYQAVRRELGAPGVKTNYGRPPYGAHNQLVDHAYRKLGMHEWLWSVDTNDWRGKSQQEVVRYVIQTAKQRDTVLMHMQWNGFNLAALKAIKRGLHHRKLALCRPYTGTSPVKLPRSLPC